MIASDVSSSTSTLVTVVTISLSTPTGSFAEAPRGSSNNTDLIVELASAGGFALLLIVIALLFCLRHTRTKHHRRIEDMERRLNGLEHQTRPPPARRMKRFSTVTSTNLGSSWGAWRSKDNRNFKKLQTVNQATSGENRKSFGHGWWSLQMDQDHQQDVTPLQDIAPARAANPPQTVDASENDIEMLKAPRLSTIVESSSPSSTPAPVPVPGPVPVRPDSLSRQASHHGPPAVRPHPSSLLDGKEIDVSSELLEKSSQKYDTSSMGKEVAVSEAIGQRCPSPAPRPQSPTHQRIPALAGSVSMFPPGTSTGPDTLRSTSSRHRPFSMINEDLLAAPRRPIPPPPPTRKPIVNRTTKGYSHNRTQSTFSDDSRSSMNTSMVGRISAQSNHVRSSSAQSNTIWPWDVHSPEIDYGSASAPLPRFKQHRSPKAVAEESHNRLQNLTTSELDVSSAARIKSTDPRAADIANSYRILVEKEGKPEPVAKDSSSEPTNGSEGKNPFSSVPQSPSSHASFTPASPVSSSIFLTRSSEGSPFHDGKLSTRSKSSLTTSTSYLERATPRSRSGTDPVLHVAASASKFSTVSTRREASKTSEKKSSAANGSSPDLNIVIPTPTLHYYPPMFGNSKIQLLPKCQYARKVEPILEQDESMKSAKPVFKHLDWKGTSRRSARASSSRSFESVSPSNVPSGSTSVECRKSREQDDVTYKILTGSSLDCQSSFKKKHSLVGASEMFSVAEDTTPSGIVLSHQSNDGQSPSVRNSRVGSSEGFPSYADCFRKEIPSVKSVREDDNLTNRRISELKKTRRAGSRGPPSPCSISRDKTVDSRSRKASRAHDPSYTEREHVSVKTVNSLIPSAASSETTLSEIDARETNQILLQSFPVLPLPSPPPSSFPSSPNPFTKSDLSSTRSLLSDRQSGSIASTRSARKGFGPGPSLSLLEKWENQGRSYITSHAAIAENEDVGIQTFARGRVPRNVSAALDGGQRRSGGETHGPSLLENTRNKVKHTRWESRGEIAEIIPQTRFLQKPVGALRGRVRAPESTRDGSRAATNTPNVASTALPSSSLRAAVSSKSPLKPLLKPSESARRAEMVGMKKSIDDITVRGREEYGGVFSGDGDAGASTSKKITPRGSSPARRRGPKVEELGKILGGKGVGW